MEPRERAVLLAKLKARPWLAHQFFFAGRHSYPSAPFHRELVEDWFSSHPRVLHKAFRSAAKTTHAEEAIALMGCFKLFNNMVILKASDTRAIESLQAIRSIYSTNERIIDFFGDMLGKVNSQTKLVLANGLALHAAGKGSSLRGMKHNNSRPDLMFGDDIEDLEDVRSRIAHDQFMTWLYAEVLPSLQQPVNRVRIVGTPLADRGQCMIEDLLADPEWKAQIVPIRYFDDTGVLVSAWPELFSLEKISKVERDYRRAGKYETFAREYLVEGTPSEGQQFNANMFKVVPTARTWQSVYIAFDPARTTSEQASFTGWAVWSITGSRIHVWEADGAHIAPDEIRNKIFELHEKYTPTFIGVEKDGLELFLMQPLRAEMLRRGTILPIKALRAPRDRSKRAFIEGLQPFAASGAITINEPMDTLVEQFVNHPRGRNDTINALAYALVMQGGAPIYDFMEASLDEDVTYNLHSPAYAILHSNGVYTTATICQYFNNRLSIISDFVSEGPVSQSFGDLMARINIDRSTSAFGRVQIKYMACPNHFATRDTIGLRSAAQAARVQLGQGGEIQKGRVELQKLLSKVVHNEPAVRINPLSAPLTARGLAGGYFASALSDTSLNPIPEQNIYSVVMEALESFAAAMSYLNRPEDGPLRYAVSRDGRTYLTSKP